MGTVGRMQQVKDQVTLAEAFVRAIKRGPASARLRLVMIGDGPLRARVEKVLDQAGCASWPGCRARETMCRKSCAVSIASCSRRWRKASPTRFSRPWRAGLPVVATRVGGNPELIEEGMTGRLVPQANPEAMATGPVRLFRRSGARAKHGRAGRQLIRAAFQP